MKGDDIILNASKFANISRQPLISSLRHFLHWETDAIFSLNKFSLKSKEEIILSPLHFDKMEYHDFL